MRVAVLLAPALVLIGYTSALAAQTRSDGIFIVGALHSLHGTEPGFDFAALRRVIDAIKPDVMVLEVRPDELQERKDTPGRPEYPQVVWPMLKERTIQAIAMEPGEPLFSELVGAASSASNQFRQRDSSVRRSGRAYERAGQRDAAIAAYRKALELNPGMFSSREGLRRLGASP